MLIPATSELTNMVIFACVPVQLQCHVQTIPERQNRKKTASRMEKGNVPGLVYFLQAIH